MSEYKTRDMKLRLSYMGQSADVMGIVTNGAKQISKHVMRLVISFHRCN